MSFFSPSFDCKSLKSNLKLCVSRLDLLQKKKTEMGMKNRREIANLLKQGKIDRSRIKCEQIVREDYVVEAMESLKTYCEVLLSRFGILESKSEVDPSLEVAITTLIWSSRLGTEVPELTVITELFKRKYTKPFVQSCLENRLKKTDQNVMKKLSLEVPQRQLVEQYLIEIAKAYDVEYEPNIDFLNKDENDGLICLDLIPPSVPGTLPAGHVVIPSKWNYGENSASLPYPTTSPFPQSHPPHPVPSQLPVVNNVPEVPGFGNDFPTPSNMQSFSDEKGGCTRSFHLPSVPDNSSADHSPGPSNNADEEFDSLSKRFDQLRNRNSKGNPPRG